MRRLFRHSPSLCSFSRFSGRGFSRPAAVAVLLVTATWLLTLEPGVRASSEYRDNAAAVRINEINTGAPDWIELVNTGDSQIDLAGWRLRFWAKDLEDFQYEGEPFEAPAGIIMQPGEFLIVAEAALPFDCACLTAAFPTWSNMEGLACLLEDAAGRAVDAVIVEGISGPPVDVLPPEAAFAPPYPVRLREDVIARVRWQDTDAGDDWACGGVASPCGANPGQEAAQDWPLATTVAAADVFRAAGAEPRTTGGAALPTAARSNGFATEHVIIVVVDGLRYHDAFEAGFPDAMPNVNLRMRANGVFCTNFYNTGITITTAGHINMTSGLRLSVPNNSKVAHNVFAMAPTIFEYYRTAMAKLGIPPATSLAKTVEIYGKYTECSTLATSLYPGYGPAWGARIRFPDLEAGDPSKYHRDSRVYETVIAELSQNHPNLMLLNMAEVDQRGHASVWDNYEFAFRKADEYLAAIWKHIQADPEYRDHTTLFALSDHGRHDMQHGGFAHHGCTCYGCRHSWLMVLGPDTPAGVTCEQTYELSDLCTTVGVLLGFETPFSEGHFMSQLFTAAQPSPVLRSDPQSLSNTAGRSRNPSLAGHGNNLAAAWLDDSAGVWQALCRRSSDAGATWSETHTLELPVSSEKEQWVRLAYNGAGQLHVALTAVQDPEVMQAPTPWKTYFANLDSMSWLFYDETGLMGTSPDVLNEGNTLQMAWSSLTARPNTASPYDGSVKVALQESPHELLHFSTVTDTAAFPARPRLARSGNTLHLVYFYYEKPFWDIAYARSTDRGTTWNVAPLLLPVESNLVNDPEIAAAGDDVVILYRFRALQDDRWRLMYVHSGDAGVTWSAPQPFTVSGDAEDAALAASPDVVAAVWSEFHGRQSSIYGRLSTDGGATWSAEENWTPGAAMAVTPQLRLVGGEPALLWADQGADRSEIYFRKLELGVRQQDVK